MIVCEGDKITFENKSDSNYLVSAGVIFEKSGLYNVLVESKRTVISKVADSQMDWIPCSERLPEAGQGCLVCHRGAIGIDTFIGHDHPYKWNLYVRDYDAWMPLPEPWKGEDNGK